MSFCLTSVSDNNGQNRRIHVRCQPLRAQRYNKYLRYAKKNRIFCDFSMSASKACGKNIEVRAGDR